MHAAPKITHLGIPDSGVAMLPGGSPEFGDALASFADEVALSALRPLFPYCVLLKNESTSRLLAILVRYELTDDKGKVIPHHFMLGTINHKPHLMIPPGAFVLITPITGLNVLLQSKPAPVGVQHTDELTYFISSTVDQYSKQSAISVSLDSVVFEDGTLVGPDRTKNLHRINAWISAEKEVAAALAGRRGPDVIRYLSTILETPAKVASSYSEVDQFDDHRRSFASGLLQRFDAHQSVDTLLAEVNSRVESLTPTLRRKDIR
ncbi:MAG: hypothetical protein J0H49_26955 [Acidobacteria bacterium]|nr:hypothetical protein [Acidobacteriota bacterium]